MTESLTPLASSFNIEVHDTLAGMQLNGAYLQSGNVIHVALDSMGSVLNTISHEFTHFIEQNATAEEFEKFKQFMREQADRRGGPLKRGWEMLVEDKLKEYADQKLSDEENRAVAESEALASMCEDMMNDRQSIADFIQKDMTLGEKILKLFDEVLARFEELVGRDRSTRATKMVDELEKARRMWFELLEDARKNAAEGGEQGEGVLQKDIYMSLMEFEQDGKRFVNIDNDQELFEGHPEKDYPSIARMIISKKFGGKVIGTKNKAFVNSVSANEYKKILRGTDQEAINARFKAAGEIDNMLDAGEYYHEKDGQDGHYHENVKDGFKKIKTILRMGGRYYEGKISIKETERGDLFYGISKLKDVTEAIQNSYGTNPKERYIRTSSINNIQHTSDDVNTDNRASRRLMPEHDRERTDLDKARDMYRREQADPMRVREIEAETRKNMRARGATEEETTEAIRKALAEYRQSLLPESARKLVDNIRLAKGSTFRDVIRNLDRFGRGSKETRQQLYETIERPFNEASDQYTRSMNATLQAIKDVFEANGIDVEATDRKTRKREQEMSAAVQKFGEGFYMDENGDRQTYTLDDLKADYPADWQNIANVAQYCRELYDEYIDDMNQMLEQIYPNIVEHAETKVSKFKELEDAARTKSREQDDYVKEDGKGNQKHELVACGGDPSTEDGSADARGRIDDLLSDNGSKLGAGLERSCAGRCSVTADKPCRLA